MRQISAWLLFAAGQYQYMAITVPAGSVAAMEVKPLKSARKMVTSLRTKECSGTTVRFSLSAPPA